MLIDLGAQPAEVTAGDELHGSHRSTFAAVRAVNSDEAGSHEPHPLLLLGAFAAAALWLAFRHLSQFDHQIVGNSGDGFLNFWIVQWVQAGLPHGWQALWNAPIFRPAHDTFAYSDTLALVALVDWPLRAVLGAVPAFNIVYLATWVLCGWATYRLACRYTAHWGAAFVGALMFTYSSARLSEFVHFQLIAGGALVPLTLLALLRVLDAPSASRGALLGLTFVALMLTSTYYGVMTAVLALIALVVWFAVRRPHGWRPYASALGVATAVVAALFGPVAFQYDALQRHASFRRTIGPRMTLHVRDFFVAPARAVATRLPAVGRHLAPNGTNHTLFPGFLTLILALVGFVVVIRGFLHHGAEHDVRRLELAALAVGAAVDLVLAFGLAVNVLGHHVPLPFDFLQHHLPGFTGIRAVFRFALAVQLVLALFAVVGIDALVRRRARAVQWVTTASLSALVVGGATVAVPLIHIPTASDGLGITTALRHAPPGTVVELPLQSEASGGPRWAYVEAPRELVARYDGHPRVNGYSGYEPTGYTFVARALNAFPSAASLREARALGVRYVVLRTRFFVGTPNSLRRFDGFDARYTQRNARRMVEHLPRDAATRVEQVRGGYVIELRQPARARHPHV